MEGLVDSVGAPIQGTLDEPDHGWRDADRAVDRASARFGVGSVRPASLIPDRDRDREREKDRDKDRDRRRPGQPNG
jgi:DNA polymerase-4